ncbi:MAG: antitoxin family protein [Thermoguttaceae bacterium]|jgi:predicted DNA-binding antitoxin AbrB/MazE fold protein
MKPVHAHFENGIFRPTEQVDLPENCEVVFSPTIVSRQPTDDSWHGELHAILSRSYETGQNDLAARHDELQS